MAVKCFAKARVLAGKTQGPETQDGNTLMLFLHLSINLWASEVDCLLERELSFSLKALWLAWYYCSPPPVATWAGGSKW